MQGGSFEEATRYMIEAMLQSPRFLYRIENQVGDGTAWPVGQYELATRLSYMIWGRSSPPDEQLMKLADEGKLDRAEVEKQAQRMLDDPRAIEHSKQFIIEWLDLNRLANLSPNPKKIPPVEQPTRRPTCGMRQSPTSSKSPGIRNGPSPT